MGREYLNYVNDAVSKGMSPDEVRYLFSDIYNKANTKQGKQVLRLFAKGIGKAKKHTLLNQNTVNQNMVNKPEQMQADQPVETKGGYQYVFFKQ